MQRYRDAAAAQQQQQAGSAGPLGPKGAAAQDVEGSKAGSEAGAAAAAPAQPEAAAGSDGAPPKRSLADDWASLRVALRCATVWCGGAWRCLYAMAVYGLQYFTPLIVGAMLGSVRRLPPGRPAPRCLPAPAFYAPDTLSTLALPPAPPKQGTSSTEVTLLSAIPYAAAALFHICNALHSTRTGERRLHIALPWLAGGVFMVGSNGVDGSCLHWRSSSAKYNTNSRKTSRCCLPQAVLPSVTRSGSGAGALVGVAWGPGGGAQLQLRNVECRSAGRAALPALAAAPTALPLLPAAGRAHPRIDGRQWGGRPRCGLAHHPAVT